MGLTVDQRDLDFWRSLPPKRTTMRECMDLPEYSATNPTGVRPGKRWRRHNGVHDPAARKAGLNPRWILCEYAPDDHEPDRYCVTLRHRAVIRVPMGRRVHDERV